MKDIEINKMILKRKEKVDDRKCDNEIKYNKYLTIWESFKHARKFETKTVRHIKIA